jgi:hypothetical protein
MYVCIYKERKKERKTKFPGREWLEKRGKRKKQQVKIKQNAKKNQGEVRWPQDK